MLFDNKIYHWHRASHTSPWGGLKLGDWIGVGLPMDYRSVLEKHKIVDGHIDGYRQDDALLKELEKFGWLVQTDNGWKFTLSTSN